MHLSIRTLTDSTTSWSGSSAPVDSTETGGGTLLYTQDLDLPQVDGGE